MTVSDLDLALNRVWKGERKLHTDQNGVAHMNGNGLPARKRVAVLISGAGKNHFHMLPYSSFSISRVPTLL